MTRLIMSSNIKNHAYAFRYVLVIIAREDRKKRHKSTRPRLEVCQTERGQALQQSPVGENSLPNDDLEEREVVWHPGGSQALQQPEPMNGDIDIFAHTIACTRCATYSADVYWLKEPQSGVVGEVRERAAPESLKVDQDSGQPSPRHLLLVIQARLFLFLWLW